MTPPLTTAGYSYCGNAAASVSISISSPGSGPDGLFSHSTRHHPPGSFNSSTNEHVFSPAAVPQTASSDSTMPVTLFSHPNSKSSVHQSEAGLVHCRTSSTTKGKGGSYPRPGVSPAEYTQRQQHLNRHTQAGVSSAGHHVPHVVPPNVKPTPDDAMQRYAQRQGTLDAMAAGQRGPLKVVDSAPRPESIVAFQKQNVSEAVVPKYTAAAEVVGSMMASGVKKARGFMSETTVTWAKADDIKLDQKTECGTSEQDAQDGSRWNVLRSALKRGMSSTEKGEPPSVQVQTTPIPFKQRESVEKIYEQASETATSSTTSGSTSAGKLEFFERYKKMAETTTTTTTTTTNPGLLTRTISNTSAGPTWTSPIERQMMDQSVHGHREPRVRTRAEVLESLHEEEPAAVLALSPIESRLEAAYMNDVDPDFAWTQQRDHQHVARTERERIVTSRKKEATAQMHHSSPRDRHAGRLHQSHSISSLDSTQAEKIKMGETNLLTPSTSIDRLAEVLHGREKPRDAFTPTTKWDEELDPIEGLVDQPPPAPSCDASFYSMLSPNLSRATSGQFHRSQQRESSVSSLLAPSDSVSTPGLSGDKFRVDPSIVMPVRETPRPGTRMCQKCGQNLKGKRFIDRDGIMLCESDWKEMFLPKCRRCEKPIETSAVSSRDGQLKGKWHRACFSCYRCSQEFEGDSFYVHDDKPYCQLHYHEANGSLCASTQCGKPIEGPCLLTANNQRYHPGHLACDYGDEHRPCRDPMMDYYEIGTLKVCERHKDTALTDTIKRSRKGRSSGMTAKAEKRRTRLIEA
ncbi:hypothetical protein QFC22_005635 [Naganishia vaughanmartiniae]|uniref:Uncharacterized protein n=1 Tax=Naganishia vaughanmartiniae TaxID=1424756 RepID=A0ACC2WSL5_9TREE|nr:hypothetical protein QFC22_005635 [Naganishia vaughanmartiniae]